MVRTVDCESRKKAVLAAAINHYIEDAQPVSSDALAKEFNLSSATIRSIFVDLETAGYLMHPHTSAGRIPTDRGYRYYVDFLLSQIDVLDHETDSIMREYTHELGRLEDVLERTSEAISTITHYTSVVSLLDWHDRLFYKGLRFILEQPEFQDVARTQYLIRIIEDKKELLSLINRDFDEKVKVYIGQELGLPQMSGCALAVATYSIKKRRSGRLAVLGPIRMEYNHIIPTLEHISGVLSEMLE